MTQLRPVDDPAPVAGVSVAAERAATLGTRGRHHFNSAGAALPTTAVVDAVVAHLRLEQEWGGYEAAKATLDDRERVYVDAATVLGAHPEEIGITDSATTGLRFIFDALRLGPGDVVIAPESTYVSQALRLLTLRDEDGVEMVRLPSVADGTVDLDALEEALRRPRAGRAVVSSVHIPTSSGLVEPAAQVGALARAHGALHIIDATQSVGHVEVDVAALSCDALVTTGRKFLRGPRGTGFFYVSTDLAAGLRPWAPDVRTATWTHMDGYHAVRGARRLETWEASVAAVLGLGVALRELTARTVAATSRAIVDYGVELRAALALIDGVEIADPAASPSGIVTFTVPGVDARAVADQLRRRAVDTIAIPASHAQWDLGRRGYDAVVRASAHVYNDGGDRDALLEAVEDIARRGRTR